MRYYDGEALRTLIGEGKETDTWASVTRCFLIHMISAVANGGCKMHSLSLLSLSLLSSPFFFLLLSSPFFSFLLLSPFLFLFFFRSPHLQPRTWVSPHWYVFVLYWRCWTSIQLSLVEAQSNGGLTIISVFVVYLSKYLIILPGVKMNAGPD